MDWRGLKVWCSGSLCVAFLFVSSAITGPDDPVNLKLDPDRVDIGTFYHGAEVQVKADVVSCDGAVLVMEAGAEEITFNRKGRKAGIWLSVAKVAIGGVPKVYLMGSSKDLDSLCSVETQRDLGLGIASLRNRMEIDSDRPLLGNETDEFLKLKEETGTYSTTIPVSLTSGTGDQSGVTAQLSIPATVPPGDYNMSLYCFTNGQLVQKGMSILSIRQIGLTELLASLAFEHAAAYGVAAILIAMVVGVLMGMIFHSRPGSGH